jgi:hypothetical protein
MKTLIAEERRVETQLLLARPEGWDAYTYVWNDAQTDAILAKGAARVRLPSGREHLVATECTACHSAEFPTLGLEAAQLDRDDAAFGTRRGNPLRTLEALKMLDAPVPRERYTPLARLDRYDPADRRARSYLHATCSFCHADLERDPCASPWVLPGHPEESPLLVAIAQARMPPVATLLPDARAIPVVSEWILRCQAQRMSP